MRINARISALRRSQTCPKKHEGFMPKSCLLLLLLHFLIILLLLLLLLLLFLDVLHRSFHCLDKRPRNFCAKLSATKLRIAMPARSLAMFHRRLGGIAKNSAVGVRFARLNRREIAIPWRFLIASKLRILGRNRDVRKIVCPQNLGF